MDGLATSLVVGVLPQSPSIAGRFCSAALASGWKVCRADEDEIASSSFGTHDVVVLTLDYPSDNDLAWISNKAHQLPMPLAVIAKDSEPRVIAGVLRAGADEYIVHPFALEELVARIRNLAVRARGESSYCSPTWICLDHRQRLVSDGVRCVTFSGQEWSVLITLLEHGDELLSADELAALCSLTASSPASVTSVISRVRKRLSTSSFDAISIQTVHGRGYGIRLRCGTNIASWSPG